MKRYSILLVLLNIFFFSCKSQLSNSKSITTSTRVHLNFNDNWKFIQENIVGAEATDYNDSSWKTVNVPHDWSIEGEYDKDNPMAGQCGYLPGGFGWYRKTIDVPQNWKGKFVEIAFDGIFMNSTVYANGKKLGNRPYGWISFAYNISDIIKNSDKITFAVHVDNDKQPSARWYTGSGIYAHTWIDVKNNNHIVRDGIFIKTKNNRVSVSTELSSKANGTIRQSVVDKEGNIIASIQNSISSKNEQQLILENPILWSLETPYLYTLKSELIVDKKQIDVVETKFGFRDIEWIPESGFWLNGKNIKLQGVCNHQDAGALGAAVPDKILRFRIQQLKDMGVNAIRTAHNPQTPTFYNLCDEMGMLVMDEIFDGWKRKAKNDYGAHFFDEWWQKDLTDWIKRDRNHPSIVIYSVGNETGGKVGKDLVELCNQLDPTRPVTSGHSGSQFMDVLGVNGSSEKGGYMENLDKKRNGKAFVGTENTHTWQVRGYYRTKTWFRDGYPNKRQRPYYIPDLTEEEVFTHDWTEKKNKTNRKQIFNSSYDNATVRVSSRLNIAQLRDIPSYAGSFRWTGYDYIGEASYVHGGWPFKAFMGGAIDLANFEKDLYYLYQSQWTESPMVHILPHWTHLKVAKGTKIPVWVYSNCDEVELFFNNTSLGKQTPGKAWDKMQCEWLVPWQPGTLKAIGYKDNKVVSEEIIRTADTPSKIELSVDGKPLQNIKNDIVQVRVTSTDHKGEFYPYGENRTYFHVFGAGKIKALDNGSPVDVEQHVGTNNRIAFYGLTRAYIVSTDNNSDINLLAASILGEKKLITSNKVSIDTKILNLRGNSIQPDLKIYYTINGNKPTKESTLYTKSFPVNLGTTVRALVLVDGEEQLYLEETFSNDVGFTWNKTTNSDKTIGEQAEDATIINGTVSNAGINFNGKGFVILESKNASIAWYQENDGDQGKIQLSVRYSTSKNKNSGIKVNIFLNNKIVQKETFFPETQTLGKDWNTINISIPIVRGANNIKLQTVSNHSIYIDEIKLQ